MNVEDQNPTQAEPSAAFCIVYQYLPARTPAAQVKRGHGPAGLGLLAGPCQVPDDFDQLGGAEIADLFEGA